MFFFPKITLTLLNGSKCCEDPQEKFGFKTLALPPGVSVRILQLKETWTT
jgi:hypothetical protein